MLRFIGAIEYLDFSIIVNDLQNLFGDLIFYKSLINHEKIVILVGFKCLSFFAF